MDSGGANLEELLCDRPCVVVAHAMVRSECNVVSRLDLLAWGESNSILLSDLFDEGLGVLNGGSLLELESRRSRGVLELGVESVLLSRTCLVGAVLGCGESERSGAGCQGSCLYARDSDGIESDSSSLAEQCKRKVFKSSRRGKFPGPRPIVASGQNENGGYIQEQP